MANCLLTMLHRLVLLTLIPLLLSACGEADKAAPSKAPTAAATPAPVVAPAAAPVAAPAAVASSVEPQEVPHEPVPKPKVKAETAPLGKPLAPARLPVATAKNKGAPENVPDVHRAGAHSKLDLRLPQDVLHGLDADLEELKTVEKPLLPPMFEDKSKQESPFQVGGRLIQRERGERVDPNEDNWHSDIRGAELQFQFRN
ncbi:hypothetical secreted protein [Pseudomonas knackmussii B13]|uniref:Hypothetical secreted protein n=2 Tax=Pseudomonas knackmussii TaxID=65741 RepID=A0A024HKK7_PSEKB|nr:hypothetical secreted protein [Pseudomonas knackmussii B13]